ncbi:MAG: hypothetical protein IPN36_11045 [Bacteroidetes bacterium]|nr:hypothetical protein [Bacteroidota bacterium]
MKSIAIHQRIKSLIILLFLSGNIAAQSNNALAFDGINDYVAVPAASALIANSPAYPSPHGYTLLILLLLS